MTLYHGKCAAGLSLWRGIILFVISGWSCGHRWWRWPGNRKSGMCAELPVDSVCFMTGGRRSPKVTVRRRQEVVTVLIVPVLSEQESFDFVMWTQNADARRKAAVQNVSTAALEAKHMSGTCCVFWLKSTWSALRCVLPNTQIHAFYMFWWDWPTKAGFTSVPRTVPSPNCRC